MSEKEQISTYIWNGSEYEAYQYTGNNLLSFVKMFKQKFYELNPHILKTELTIMRNYPQTRQFKKNDWVIKHIESGIVSICPQNLFKEFIKK